MVIFSKGAQVSRRTGVEIEGVRREMRHHHLCDGGTGSHVPMDLHTSQAQHSLELGVQRKKST